MLRTAALVAIPGLGSPGSTRTLMSEALGGSIRDRSQTAGAEALEAVEAAQLRQEESSSLEESLLPPDLDRSSKRQ